MLKVWFLGLSKRNKVTVVLTVVALLIIFYFGIKTYYYKNQLLKEQAKQIEALQLEKEGYLQQVDLLQIEYDLLEQQKQTVIVKTIEVENQLKDTKDETNNVPGVVNLFTNKQLDSTIRSYKHIQRTKN